MGISLQKQGRLVKAIEASQKAIDIQPDFFEAYNNMGISLQKQGRLEEALVAYRALQTSSLTMLVLQKTFKRCLSNYHRLSIVMDTTLRVLKCK